MLAGLALSSLLPALLVIIARVLIAMWFLRGSEAPPSAT
jgi:hypothetical protein